MSFPSIIAICLAFVGVLGDICLKKAGGGPRYLELEWFGAGVLIFALASLGWVFVLKSLKLSVAGSVSVVATILFLTLAGHLFFGERLIFVEWLGVLLAILSILLLSRFT